MIGVHRKARRLMDTDIDVVMGRVSPYLDVWDGLLRQAHSVYTSYPPEYVIDHDSSTQAHCTFRHILAGAHRAFDGVPHICHFEVRGQNLWLMEDADVLIRFKKTDGKRRVFELSNETGLRL